MNYTFNIADVPVKVSQRCTVLYLGLQVVLSADKPLELIVGMVPVCPEFLAHHQLLFTGLVTGRVPFHKLHLFELISILSAVASYHGREHKLKIEK